MKGKNDFPEGQEIDRCAGEGLCKMTGKRFQLKESWYDQKTDERKKG